MAAVARDEIVWLRGLPFHYRDWGGHGVPLVLLHGLASNARFWDLAAPYLVDRFRVVALDQRGHGASAKPDDGYDFSTVAGDVYAFVQTLELTSLLLAGHSWGGNVVLQVGADYPALARGLVCIDGGQIEPSASPGATWESTRDMLTPPNFAEWQIKWEDFLERSKTWQASQTRTEEQRVAFLRANFDVIEDGTVRPKLTFERHMKIVRALWDQRVSTLYPRISAPVLLMPARQAGEARTSAGWQEEKEAAVAKAARMLRRSRVVWMEDSIHDVPVQRPKEVAAVLIEAAREGFFH